MPGHVPVPALGSVPASDFELVDAAAVAAALVVAELAVAAPVGVARAAVPAESSARVVR